MSSARLSQVVDIEYCFIVQPTIWYTAQALWTGNDILTLDGDPIDGVLFRKAIVLSRQ